MQQLIQRKSQFFWSVHCSAFDVSPYPFENDQNKNQKQNNTEKNSTKTDNTFCDGN